MRAAPDRRHRLPGRRRPRRGATSSRRSTSAWAARSGPTPASSTGSSTPCRSTTSPTRCSGSSRRYQSERRDDEPFHNWARRVPNDELAATLAGLDADQSRWGVAMKGFTLREEMNGDRRAAGQDLVLGARGRSHRRRPLHPVRHLRGRLPVELDRGQRGQRSARAGEDVHRLLAVLGLLPPRRAALRGAVAAVDVADRGP